MKKMSCLPLERKRMKRETKNEKMCKWERVHVGGRRKVGKKVNPVIFNVYTIEDVKFLKLKYILNF
jgi:hypothetical protein